MANHPNRRPVQTVVYLRDAQGLLSRHVVAGMTQAQHRAQYSVGPETDTEVLAGWPENFVRWHGHVGYATTDAPGGLGPTVTERACETCRYVMQRRGNTPADQRCRAYSAGKSHMMTRTATRDPKRCGPDRIRWAPPPTAEETAAVEREKQRILAAGGPRADLMRFLMS